MTNKTETIQQIYACFGVGDIPGIMEKLADNAVFEHNGKLPWSGRFEGKANVGRFFNALDDNVTVTTFRPTNFRTEGDQVVNDCRFEAIAKSNQKPFGYDLKMSWDFDAQGKPNHYAGYTESSELVEAEACFQ